MVQSHFSLQMMFFRFGVLLKFTKFAFFEKRMTDKWTGEWFYELFFVSTRFISTLGSVSSKNKHIAKHAPRLRFGQNLFFFLFSLFFSSFFVFFHFLIIKALTVFSIRTIILAVRVIFKTMTDLYQSFR